MACGICRQPGHNRRTCPLRQAAHNAAHQPPPAQVPNCNCTAATPVPAVLQCIIKNWHQHNVRQPIPLDDVHLQVVRAGLFGAPGLVAAMPMLSTTSFITAWEPHLHHFNITHLGRGKKDQDILARAAALATRVQNDPSITTITLMDGHGRLIFHLLRFLKARVTQARLDGLVFRIVDINGGVIQYHRQIFFTTAFTHHHENIFNVATPRSTDLVYFNFCGVANAMAELSASIPLLMPVNRVVFVSMSTVQGAKKCNFPQKIRNLQGVNAYVSIGQRGDFVTLMLSA